MSMLDSFTPTTPFGIELYPRFAAVYEAVVGKPAASFEFVPGKTPLSGFLDVALVCVAYLVVIFGGQAFMQQRKPRRLQALFQIHNALLTVVSAALLFLMVEQIFPQVYHHGLYYSVCDSGAWTQKMQLLYYLNYLVKYWELADTIFLVAKKKKLEFLHYYHHSMTAMLCYTQLVGQTPVSWVPIVLNLTVHVFMYYYYLRAAAGARLWWKRYLTTGQITQFVIDLFVIYFCAYNYFASSYWSDLLPYHGTCQSNDSAAWFGCGLLSSYLVLFVQFYRNTYRASKKKTA